MPPLLEAFFTALVVLSTLGALSMWGYLALTQKKAPRFAHSYEAVDRTSSFLTASVSIIITAKDEEEKIEHCLQSLLAQSYPAVLEILVVDDSSVDRTKELARSLASQDPRIRVIEAGPKPQGWVGKSWACWRGYEESKGELLLFVDADSTFSQNTTLERTVRYLLAKGYDIFSLSPKMRLKGPWASSTLPLVSGAINLLYPLSKVNNPQSNRAYVFGTFVLVRKEVYAAIDGHRAVRELLVEDAAIAQLAKARGYKLRVEVGREELATDWEESRTKIYHGLERILSIAIRRYGLLANVNAVFLFFVGLYPLLFAIGSVLFWDGNWIGFLASLVGIACFLGLAASELRLVTGKVGALPLLYPLGVALLISAIASTSVKLRRGKGLEWKGAVYTQQAAAN